MLEQKKNDRLYLVSATPAFAKNNSCTILREMQCIMKVTVHQKGKKAEVKTQIRALQSFKVNFDKRISLF